MHCASTPALGYSPGFVGQVAQRLSANWRGRERACWAPIRGGRPGPGLDEQRMRILLLRCGEARIIPPLFKELPWESQGGALKGAHPGSDSGDS